MKQFLNVFSILLCIILSVVLYVIVLSFSSVIMCRGIISENGIKNIMDEVDILELPTTNSSLNKEMTNETLKDEIVKEATEKGISEILVLQVLEDEKFEQITTDFVTKYSNYIVNGGQKPEINNEDLDELILSSRNIVKEQTGYVIPDSQVDELSKVSLEFADKVNNSIPTKEQVIEKDSYTGQILELVYSNWFVFLSICGIIAILLIIMFLRFNVIAPLIWGGVAFIGAGSSLTLIAILKTVITALIKDVGGIYAGVFQAISGSLFKNIYFYGIGVLLLGVGMVISHNIIKKKRIKKEKNA